MKFFEFVRQHNYCEGLMICTALITFIFSLIHYGRHRAFRNLPYYFGSFLLLEGVGFYRYISPQGDPFANVLDTTSTAAFIIFELCVFSLLILHYITGAGRRLAIKLNTAIFFIGEIIFYFRVIPRNPIVSMCLLEGVALVVPCVIYFYELFTNVNTRALKDRPSFWVVNGIIYQGVYNILLLLSMKYMGRFSGGAYALGILFYCILFVLFMIAYKCSPEELVVS